MGQCYFGKVEGFSTLSWVFFTFFKFYNGLKSRKGSHKYVSQGLLFRNIQLMIQLLNMSLLGLTEAWTQKVKQKGKTIRSGEPTSVKLPKAIPRGVFRTLLNIYNGVFLQNTKHHKDLES